jgi:tol-pal system protein YbgF
VKQIATLAIAVAAALVVAGCTSLTPAEDPVYLRLTDFEARLLRVERVLQNESLITMSTQLDQLRSDVAGLRGQIEEVRFDVEGNAQRQRDLYLDLDQRLQLLEQGQGQAAFGSPPGVGGGGFDAAAPPFGAGAAGAAPTATPPPVGNAGQFGGPAAGNAGAAAPNAGFGAASSAAAPPPVPVLKGSDQENYNRAYELLEPRRDFVGAERAFTEFLAAFPTSPLAPNAQYWLGETYYVRNLFQEALPAFQRVIDEYPTSQKVPDALLKLGYVHDALGNTDAARTTLRQVMERYPNTTFARLASVRLSQPHLSR